MTVFVDESAFPNSTVVYVVARFGSSTATGSGVLVGRNDVLTAAHVVYDSRTNRLADSITVYGIYNPSQSFDPSNASIVAAPSVFTDFDRDRDGLISSGDRLPNSLEGTERDIALLSLNTPLGDRFGWMDLGYGHREGNAVVTGHPGRYGRYMVEDRGYVFQDSVDNSTYIATLEVNPGNSGGPVWFVGENGRPQVAAIVSTRLAATDIDAHRWIPTYMAQNDGWLSGGSATDAGNSALGATAMGAGLIVRAETIGRNHDPADFFRVTSNTAGMMSVFVTGVTTDVRVEVQSTAGSVLASSNRAGVAGERLTFSAAANTDYVVAVRGSTTTSSPYTLVVSPQNQPSTEATPVFRFLNLQTGSHFYTSSLSERDGIIEQLPRMSFEGERFQVPSAASVNSTPVYRLLNTATNTHLYTINEGERAALLDGTTGFRDEGLAFNAFPQDSGPQVPLYRFFNTQTGVHFFTANEGERAAILGTMAWMQPEGIACYVL